MYRNNQQVLTSQKHGFILNHGALGDVICSLPAIIHGRRSAPSMTLNVYCPHWQVDLLKHLLAPYGEFNVLPLNDETLAKEARDPDQQNSMNAPVKNTHTRNRVHMVDFAFNYLLDARPENMSQRCYPTLAPLGQPVIPGNYVVFPVGATSDNKLFRASVMTPILQWVIDKGYSAVLVGTKVTHTHAEMGGGLLEKLTIRDQADMVPKALIDKCIDMREKTTLLELRDILGYAKAVVGVDGGTLHLAGTTDTNIVYAMGTTLPKHRYIARLGDPNHKIRYVIPRELECVGCQSNWQMTRWDFRNCPYGDNKCMEQLHPEDFTNGLKELGL